MDSRDPIVSVRLPPELRRRLEAIEAKAPAVIRSQVMRAALAVGLEAVDRQPALLLGGPHDLELGG